jgi:hypothetical protein
MVILQPRGAALTGQEILFVMASQCNQGDLE